MQFNRPIVLSVAGMDPSGGAGLLADMKTFEQHRVYGLGITTAQTVQTERLFFSIRWEHDEDILTALTKMLAHYNVIAVKIGIVQNIQSLHRIVHCIHTMNTRINIIVDPVIRSTTEFDFWQQTDDKKQLYEALQQVKLITPNYKEAVQLAAAPNAKEAAVRLSDFCNVLLKGGHNEEEPGIDYLFMEKTVLKLEPGERTVYPKHGSGCILSASIAANLALSHDLATACRYAKFYTENFLSSTHHLLGYHVS
ncbi:MAG: bifunctional hydroxymethylpyrimidine kinase/phosphomethylpyrimidine kinase [Bacteroidetes bacterium]|nr:bifunctional hydroxymethylpyrimidine kinase/phosphomethylpyrimidine kinase [Bacteroidota bacterium]